MRYCNQIRGLDETCEGPRDEYILPRTKAGKKLVRLFLRGSWTEFPEDHADIKDCRRSRRPGARLDGFDFFACAVRQQEKHYDSAQKESRERFLEAQRQEEKRLLRLYSVRHAFVGSRSSSRRKRKTILSLGIPI